MEHEEAFWNNFEGLNWAEIQQQRFVLQLTHDLHLRHIFTLLASWVESPTRFCFIYRDNRLGYFPEELVEANNGVPLPIGFLVARDNTWLEDEWPGSPMIPSVFLMEMSELDPGNDADLDFKIRHGVYWPRGAYPLTAPWNTAYQANMSPDQRALRPPGC